MPKMVKIGSNPDWRAKGEAATHSEQRENFKAIKAAGALEVSYQTALENIRQSGGMYRILPDQEPQKVKVETDLSDLSMQELKVMMLNLGVKTQKQMKRSEVIELIERKLDEVEILDDED
ncbi:hypothetical protein VWZ88_12520 [Phaeobacter sp. JH20_36]|uniref:hypothetical protein n=1 Tax=unclassified Phaeobacter TaxID=2621772 RepID=UPI003A8537D4